MQRYVLPSDVKYTSKKYLVYQWVLLAVASVLVVIEGSSRPGDASHALGASRNDDGSGKDATSRPRLSAAPHANCPRAVVVFFSNGSRSREETSLHTGTEPELFRVVDSMLANVFAAEKWKYH
ncbi:hypothetical protein PR202_gb07254 [Eleusine coracana subsp. coracana]|uniref:Uncharacterized protein n=1 Tax=Eleusine coracana subsp. coracana TaxID=191504 RepID=A0AAV5EBS9_ELECO|nr:hypothetical protein PR202_gb07254 [Eleusine coracana subsp. coracana]